MSVRNLVKSIQDIMRKDSGVDGDAQRISQLCWMFFLKIIDDQDQELELMDPDYKSPIPRKYQWRTWAADAEGITGDELLAFVNDQLFPGLKGLSTAGASSERRRVVRDLFEDAYNYMKSGQLMRQVVNKIQLVDFNNLTERQHFGDIYEQLLADLQSAGNAGEYYTPRAVTAFMVDRIDPKPGETLLDPACGTGGFLTCAIRHMRDRGVKTVKDEQKLQKGLRAVEKKPLPHMLCVTNMLLHGVEDPSFVRHDNTLARPYVSYASADRVDVVLTNPPFGGREEDGIETNFPAHFQTKETADLFLALIIRLLKPSGRAAVVLPDGSLFGEGVKTRLKEHLLEECNLHTIVRLPNSVFRPYASIGTNLLFFEKGSPTKDIWFYEHRVPEGQKAYSMTKPIRIEHLAPCVKWWGGETRKGRKETEVAWKVSAEEVKARGYNLDFKNPHAFEEEHGDPEELLAKLDAAETEAAAVRDQLKAILAEALLLGNVYPTNAERLLEHFDQIADTPAAVERLKNFSITSAVQGRFSQDIPRSRWTEKPVGVIAQAIRSGVACAKSHQKPNGHVHLRTHNVGTNGRMNLDQVIRVDQNRIDLKKAGLQKNDILFNNTNSQELVGKTCLVENDCDYAFSNHLTVIRLGDEVDPAFFVLTFIYLRQSAYFSGLCNRWIGQAGINTKLLKAICVSYPPLQEQRRLVDAVHKMINLCNQLSLALTSSRNEKLRLLDSLSKMT